jgi:hypothetical protein
MSFIKYNVYTLLLFKIRHLAKKSQSYKIQIHGILL